MKPFRYLKMLFIIFIISVPILFGFQNCANQKVGFADQSSQPLQNSTIHLEDFQNLPKSPVVSDQVIDQPRQQVHEPAVSQPIVINSICDSYVEITNDQFSIPEKDSNNICYYKKIFKGIATKDSSLSSNFSNYGEANAQQMSQYKKLLIQESESLIVNLSLNRRVAISGDYKSEAPYGVDNFIMVQVDSEKPTISGWSYYYENTALIDIQENKLITKISYYLGRNANVLDAWEITSQMPFKKNFNLKISTLDNGGSYSLTPLYLVFK